MFPKNALLLKPKKKQTFLATVSTIWERIVLKVKQIIAQEYNRIVGGDESADGSWPSVVQLFDGSNELKCTGTIISKSFILTTGSCARTDGWVFLFIYFNNLFIFYWIVGLIYYTCIYSLFLKKFYLFR